MKSRFFKWTAILAVLTAGMAATVEQLPGNYFEIAKNMELFANLYKEVNTYYVDDIDPAKLMRTGVDAMLESLDPYTNYITESQIEGFRYITEGKYNGIGADIRVIEELPTIVAPYEGSPAQKAGLKAGDQILEIDGKETKDKDPEEISAILKGFPGTEVKLSIRRPGEQKNQSFTLVRDEVNIPNVPYSGMITSEVGYIALTTFTRDAGSNVAKALEDLKVEQPNLKGVILDLRENGGGLLNEAVNLCNVFIPKNELIVSTRGKVKDWDKSFKTLNAAADEKIPLVVLINKNSASASEIVSGAVQDLDRGVLLGQESYGKGLVQNTRDIGYNAKVKLTTAKYYIPSGRCIQAIEYKQGAPARISDDKRTAFKTRNGRMVYDGGGVRPDIVLDHDAASDILQTLEEKNFIFNYVTSWILKNQEVKSAADFRFTQWDDFIEYLEKRNFDYDTESEKLLRQFREQTGKAGYLSEADIKALESKIIAAKKEELNKYRSLVVNMIEKEIVSRFLYEKGRIQIGLRNDPEISESVKLLGDQQRYESLLKGK